MAPLRDGMEGAVCSLSTAGVTHSTATRARRAAKWVAPGRPLVTPQSVLKSESSSERRHRRSPASAAALLGPAALPSPGPPAGRWRRGKGTMELYSFSLRHREDQKGQRAEKGRCRRLPASALRPAEPAAPGCGAPRPLTGARSPTGRPPPPAVPPASRAGLRPPLRAASAGRCRAARG